MISRIIKPAVFLVLFGFLFVSFAQDNKTDVVNKATDKLQQKLLLSQDQAAKVKSIVLAHFDQLKKNDTAETQKQIEGLLNDKQKDKFSIIAKDWLGSFQKNK